MNLLLPDHWVHYNFKTEKEKLQRHAVDVRLNQRKHVCPSAVTLFFLWWEKVRGGGGTYTCGRLPSFLDGAPFLFLRRADTSRRGVQRRSTKCCGGHDDRGKQGCPRGVPLLLRPAPASEQGRQGRQVCTYVGGMCDARKEGKRKIGRKIEKERGSKGGGGGERDTLAPLVVL